MSLDDLIKGEREGAAALRSSASAASLHKKSLRRDSTGSDERTLPPRTRRLDAARTRLHSHYSMAPLVLAARLDSHLVATSIPSPSSPRCLGFVARIALHTGKPNDLVDRHRRLRRRPRALSRLRREDSLATDTPSHGVLVTTISC